MLNYSPQTAFSHRCSEPRWRRAWQPCCELLPNFAVFCVLLIILLFFILDVYTLIVYDRHTFRNWKPKFEFLNAGALLTNTASEPFVWATRPRRRKRSRKRGKRADVLVRLRRCAFRPPLPTILLANIESLDNNTCHTRHFMENANFKEKRQMYLEAFASELFICYIGLLDCQEREKCKNCIFFKAHNSFLLGQYPKMNLFYNSNKRSVTQLSFSGPTSHNVLDQGAQSPYSTH